MRRGVVLEAPVPTLLLLWDRRRELDLLGVPVRLAGRAGVMLVRTISCSGSFSSTVASGTTGGVMTRWPRALPRELLRELLRALT